MENEEEKIISYIENRLTPAEKETFEKQLQAKPELQASLSLYQDLLLAGDVFGPEGIQQQLEATWQANESTPKRAGSNRRLLRFAAVIALLIVTGIAIWQIALRGNHPREFWQDTDQYAQLFSEQKERYQSARIKVLDETLLPIRSSKKQMLHPASDTLLNSQQPVLFEWRRDLANSKLEVEIFTKDTQNTPRRYPLPKATYQLRVKLPPNLYYWRFSIPNEEVLQTGRFYVVTP